jgi:hypothetical protein
MYDFHTYIFSINDTEIKYLEMLNGIVIIIFCVYTSHILRYSLFFILSFSYRRICLVRLSEAACCEAWATWRGQMTRKSRSWGRRRRLWGPTWPWGPWRWSWSSRWADAEDFSGFIKKEQRHSIQFSMSQCDVEQSV